MKCKALRAGARRWKAQASHAGDKLVRLAHGLGTARVAAGGRLASLQARLELALHALELTLQALQLAGNGLPTRHAVRQRASHAERSDRVGEQIEHKEGADRAAARGNAGAAG